MQKHQIPTGSQQCAEALSMQQAHLCLLQFDCYHRVTQWLSEQPTSANAGLPECNNQAQQMKPSSRCYVWVSLHGYVLNFTVVPQACSQESPKQSLTLLATCFFAPQMKIVTRAKCLNSVHPKLWEALGLRASSSQGFLPLSTVHTHLILTASNLQWVGLMLLIF